MNANRFVVGLCAFLVVMIVLIGYVIPDSHEAQSRLGYTLYILVPTGSVFVIVFSLFRRNWPMLVAGAGLLVGSIEPSVRWLSLLGTGMFAAAFIYAYFLRPRAITGPPVR